MTRLHGVGMIPFVHEVHDVAAASDPGRHRAGSPVAELVHDELASSAYLAAGARVDFGHHEVAADLALLHAELLREQSQPRQLRLDSLIPSKPTSCTTTAFTSGALELPLPWPTLRKIERTMDLILTKVGDKEDAVGRDTITHGSSLAGDALRKAIDADLDDLYDVCLKRIKDEARNQGQRIDATARQVEDSEAGVLRQIQQVLDRQQAQMNDIRSLEDQLSNEKAKNSVFAEQIALLFQMVPWRHQTLDSTTSVGAHPFYAPQDTAMSPPWRSLPLHGIAPQRLVELGEMASKQDEAMVAMERSNTAIEKLERSVADLQSQLARIQEQKLAPDCVLKAVDKHLRPQFEDMQRKVEQQLGEVHLLNASGSSIDEQRVIALITDAMQELPRNADLLQMASTMTDSLKTHLDAITHKHNDQIKALEDATQSSASSLTNFIERTTSTFEALHQKVDKKFSELRQLHEKQHMKASSAPEVAERRSEGAGRASREPADNSEGEEDVSWLSPALTDGPVCEECGTPFMAGSPACQCPNPFSPSCSLSPPPEETNNGQGNARLSHLTAMGDSHSYDTFSS